MRYNADISSYITSYYKDINMKIIINIKIKKVHGRREKLLINCLSGGEKLSNLS